MEYQNFLVRRIIKQYFCCRNTDCKEAETASLQSFSFWQIHRKVFRIDDKNETIWKERKRNEAKNGKSFSGTISDCGDAVQHGAGWCICWRNDGK